MVKRFAFETESTHSAGAVGNHRSRLLFTIAASGPPPPLREEKEGKLATQLLSSIKDAARRASPPKTRVDISVDATTSNDIINEQRQVLNLLLFSESINFQSLIPSTVLHSEKEGRAARD